MRTPASWTGYRLEWLDALPAAGTLICWCGVCSVSRPKGSPHDYPLRRPAVRPLPLRPILYIGLVWIWRDATRRGQPGWLWALLTRPLNWVALLAHVVVRALLPSRTAAPV